MAGHKSVRPHERSLEPLTETDGDETMMHNPGDDDGEETSAVKSKIQPMRHLPTRHVVTIHIVIGAALVLGALHKQRHGEQKSLLVASTDYGFFTDGDDGEHKKMEPLFFWW